MVWSILIIILFFVLLFASDEFILRLKNKFFAEMHKRDILYRGQNLYHWIDSISSEQMAFRLGRDGETKLPEKDCYREFGHFLHDLWEEVRVRGGQLKMPLRALKKLLRADIQRTRRERQALQSAYAQLSLMILMVWGYLFIFDRLVAVNPPLEFWLGCLGWQGFGAVIFFKLLHQKQRKVLDPLNDLLGALQYLSLIAFRGMLSQVALPRPKRPLSGDYLRYYRGLEQVLESWRIKGRADTEVLNELREDLGLLAEDAQIKFLPWIRGLGFMWAMVFVLPLLFAGSLFGLYKLAVV